MLKSADYSPKMMQLETATPVVESEKSGLKVELLEQSFNKIRPRADEFAASFYNNLFTACPEAQPMFANTNMAEQKKQLMISLVLVVDNLRSPDTLKNALKELGARHVRYGALPEHYSIIGEVLLQTFEEYLEQYWTTEVKQAWADAYNTIANLMLEGANYSHKAVESARATTRVKSSETVKLSSESGLQAELLETSLEKIKPRATEFSSSFYSNLFSAYPEAKPLFANTNMAEQEKKLISSLVLVVKNLRKPEFFETILKGLGARHVKYGALPEHYPLVGNALLTTFEQYLGSDWTTEVKQAWVDAYGVITTLMLEGADYSPEAVELERATPTVESSETVTAAVELEEAPVEAPVAESEESGLKVELLETSFESTLILEGADYSAEAVDETAAPAFLDSKAPESHSNSSVLGKSEAIPTKKVKWELLGGIFGGIGLLTILLLLL
ncbi:MAG: globin family protein [Xenococcaceae cyanobacterium]